MLQRLTKSCLLVAFFCAPRTYGASYSVLSSAGLMQQPTSHYYHFVYGGSGQAEFFEQKFLVRGSYLQRPKFEEAGFVDQDSGAFAFVGSQIAGNKIFGVTALIGGGRINGYIRATDEYYSSEDAPERSYSISGLSTALEASARWGSLHVAVNHQTFVGYVDREQLNAYVGWPYNFFLVNVGFTL